MRRLLLVVAIAALGVGTAAGSSAPARFLQTGGIVQRVAADGDFVAANVGATKGDCDHVLAWSPGTRSVVRLGGRRQPCTALSTGQSFTSLGIGGRRVVWVHDGGGNQHEQEAFTATVGFPRRTTPLAFATYEIDSDLGDHIGNVHGDDSLLVFNTWSICAGPEAEAAFRPCPAGVKAGLYSEQIWRVRGTAKTKIASAAGRLDVLAVGGGRIAVERADGSVELRDESGRVLRRLPFEPGDVAAAALTPSRLVVQHADRLAVYDAVSGRLLHDWGTPAHGRLQDADANYAALAGPRSLAVLRLSDGRLAQIGVGSGPVFAQLEPLGLFFAYSSPASRLKGRVGLLPIAALAAKF